MSESLSGLPLSELKEQSIKVRNELIAILGSGVDLRCGICFNLASEHVGGVVTGCMVGEIDEDAHRSSLIRQIEDGRLALSNLRKSMSFSADLAAIMASSQRVSDDRDKIRIILDTTVSDLKVASGQVTALTAEVASLHTARDADASEIDSLKRERGGLEARLDDVDKEAKVVILEHEQALKMLCNYWCEFIAGKWGDAFLRRKLQEDFDITISPTLFPPSGSIATPSTSPWTSPGSSGSAAAPTGPAATSTPSLPGPTAAAIRPAAGAAIAPSAAGGFFSHSSTAAAAAAIAAAASTSLSSPDDAEGDFVAKSAKEIKIVFKTRDTAPQHLSKESAILDEIKLLYGKCNTATKIAIVVKHCDDSVRNFAQAVWESGAPSFATVQDFLVAFRRERFPLFIDDCRVAYSELRQQPRETGVQFYFRFDYLVRAMNRNPHDYWDDYMRKLCHPAVYEKVRYDSKDGKSLHDLAKHVNEVENEMGVRASAAWRAEHGGVNVNETKAKGKGKGKKGKSRDKDGSEAGAGRQKGPKLSNKEKTDLWGLPARVCWHCFQEHGTTDKPCKGAPCLFCSGTNHASIRCHFSPATKEAFQKIVNSA